MGKEGYLQYPLFLPIWRGRSKEQRCTTGRMGPLYDMPLPRHSRSVRSHCTVTARGNQSHHTNKKAGLHLDITLRKGRNASGQLNPGWQDAPYATPGTGFSSNFAGGSARGRLAQEGSRLHWNQAWEDTGTVVSKTPKTPAGEKVPLLVAPSSSPSSHRNVMPVM